MSASRMPAKDVRVGDLVIVGSRRMWQMVIAICLDPLGTEATTVLIETAHGRTQHRENAPVACIPRERT